MKGRCDFNFWVPPSPCRNYCAVRGAGHGEDDSKIGFAAV